MGLSSFLIGKHAHAYGVIRSCKFCSLIMYLFFSILCSRPSAEQALSSLNGTQLGGQSIRLSWGRSPSNRQVVVITLLSSSSILLVQLAFWFQFNLSQSDQTQLGGGSYYGYSQGGYEAYGSYAPPQDPNMYYGGAGYANYQQPQQVFFHHNFSLLSTQCEGYTFTWFAWHRHIYICVMSKIVVNPNDSGYSQW